MVIVVVVVVWVTNRRGCCTIMRIWSMLFIKVQTRYLMLVVSSMKIIKTLYFCTNPSELLFSRTCALVWGGFARHKESPLYKWFSCV